MKRVRILAVLCSLTLLLTVAAQTPEKVDLKVIDRIVAAEKTSQAMSIAETLTNTYGPRLTNSPNTKAAGEYARKKLVEWKLTDVQLQTFTFGNGWSNDELSIKVVSDPATSFRAYAKPWTVGTNGPVVAEVVEGVRSQADLESMKGKLRGKFVMVLPTQPAPPPATGTTPAQRLTEAQLESIAGETPAQPAQPTAAAPALPPVPSAPGAAGPEGTPEAPAEEAGFFAWVENALSAAPAQPAGAVQPTRNPNTGMPSRSAVTKFYFEEGVAGMIEPAPTPNGALMMVAATGETSPWRRDPTTSKAPPQIMIAVEDYNKLIERIQNTDPVQLQVNIRNTYQTNDRTSFNVIGDIKGTDKADELVVLGAHLDSWTLGKGATDNAAGVAVVMEAVRVLKSLALPMRRTVRIGLWTGEEQGLLGSMAFVDKYFFQRPIRQIRAGHAKLSVYFNVDNGTGAIRGVYMQGNDAIKPIFEAWMAPFKSMGMTTVANRSVGGTDHLTFDNLGLPAFQFIQDPIAYSTTHHSDQDTSDKFQKADLEKNAAIVASWVYLAANRDELLPRKPLPKGVYPAGSPVP